MWLLQFESVRVLHPHKYVAEHNTEAVKSTFTSQGEQFIATAEAVDLSVRHAQDGPVVAGTDQFINDPSPP
jgi:hypothetical protein